MARNYSLIGIIIACVAFLGYGEVTRERLAVRELAAKAASGDPKAMYDLAMLHDIGYDSIPIDSLRSTLLYRMSAEAGYPPAQNYLGFRYFNGEGIRMDVDSALYWMARAAGKGDSKAANNLGFLLLKGEKVSRDYSQAAYWLKKAADASLPPAESQLADLYREGLGVERDTLRAIELYSLAIEHGLQDAELKLLAMMGRQWENLPVDSMLNLGRHYYTHRAPMIGVTLFENAAKKGSADAKALMGDAYSRGIGVAYDHQKSIEYFLQAALDGQPSAQFVIAELLEIFPDALTELPEYSHITEDQLTPEYWYEQASSSGITDAETATLRLLQPVP